MPLCKNDPKRKYKGNEPSPKGLGWCAHAEKEGKVRKGRDNNKWIVKKVGNGSLRWTKDSITKRTQNNFKEIGKVNKQIKYPDLTFHITFIPYLIYNDNEIKRFGNNQLTKYIINKKLSLIKKIIKNILWNCNIKKYTFNTDTYLIELKMSIYKAMYNLSPSKKYNIDILQKEILFEMTELYGSDKQFISNIGPDTWMSSNLVILKENEYDKRQYEFGIAFKKIELNKNISKK